MAVTGDLDRLAIDLATLFVLSATGRIIRVNSPGGGPGPRAILAGCRAGNLVRMRQDVEDGAAREIDALVREQTPWWDVDAPPACLPGIVALLAREASVAALSPAVIYGLPNNLRYEADARLLSGDEAEGQSLLDRLARGMPKTLLAAGFLDVDHLWPPWCAAIVGEEIAALAFAARLGPLGAEVGVYTLAGFRGRGLAAAVTARWSSLAGLAGRQLFYSTLATNLSSRRVAARLALTPLGASVGFM